MTTRIGHPCNPGRKRKQGSVKGFTLIELAVAIFILGLMVGSIMVPLNTQIKQRQIAETKKKLAEIQEALIGFAVVNGRLPRPAASATDGSERIAACANEADCTGFIPWSDLGVQRLDVWGKVVRYSVTPAFTASTLTLSAVPTKVIQERSAASPFPLIDMVPSPPPDPPTVVAVIYSHGADNWGTSELGTSFADGSTTNADEDMNAAATTTFVSRLNTDNRSAPGGEFDDIVIWLSNYTLFKQMINAGKLP